ncbi:hypothetical protein BACCELL_02306 [Bacteroides cellulosilyticus DSM 14838]|uniref:Uncharacterized protein n=1 Tax=Bacteroides cellulosilyticus DSM 14838 TaxID=537012 RepID=E2NDE7_9BACE|nr:hypothetical protein BACCELL_02306 [Bacteroides cellulosilyticus DSM 14838]
MYVSNSSFLLPFTPFLPINRKMKAKHETASQPQTNEIFNLSVLPSADN